MRHHKTPIVFGTRGEVSKIEEELAELLDANTWAWRLVESADIVEAAGQYTWRHLRCPLWLVVAVCYLRKPWKRVRNFWLDTWGRPKKDFFP